MIYFVFIVLGCVLMYCIAGLTLGFAAMDWSAPVKPKIRCLSFTFFVLGWPLILFAAYDYQWADRLGSRILEKIDSYND